MRSSLNSLQQPATENELKHLTTLAKDVKDTSLDGLPFLVASMKAKLKSDKEIADILSARMATRVTVGAVEKMTQLPGFANLVTQMMPGIWQDLILQAQGVISHHLQFGQDKELAKWLLESTGQVASSRPLTQNDNRTLIVNGGLPGQAQKQITGPMESSVDQVAMGIFQRLTDNVKLSECPPPPTVISQ